MGSSSESARAEQPVVFPESRLAHELCSGRGLEIGASAHNPFGLDALNVDVTGEWTVFKEEEMRLAGAACTVDIVAEGDAIPVDDGSQDFVVSSHVLEHFIDPIAALLEWDRVVRVGGTIFAIVPHKERTFDSVHPRTDLSHLLADHEAPAPVDHAVDRYGHQHVWVTEDIVDLIDWMRAHTGVCWSWLAIRDVDDKVGNGFTVAVRKEAARMAPEDVPERFRSPMRRSARDGGGNYPPLPVMRAGLIRRLLAEPATILHNVRRDWRFILERRAPAIFRLYAATVVPSFKLRGRVRYRWLRRRRGSTLSDRFRIAIVYTCPVDRDEQLERGVRRFVRTYAAYRPTVEHSLHVYFNGSPGSEDDRELFAGIADGFHTHDNSGWDIGVFIRASRELACDMLVCFGTYTYFTRSGWLERMAEAFRERGEGLYGASASYESTPHIRTAGFWCEPELVRAYPRRVTSYADRYEFEHGVRSITSLAESLGLGCWMVTWDGIYPKGQWREPRDIYRRGDQSNALYFDRSFDMYEAFDPVLKDEYAALADGGATRFTSAERGARLSAFVERLDPDHIRDVE